VTNPHDIVGHVGPLVDEQAPVRRSAQRLRNTLRINTVTSLAGGLAAAVAARPVSQLLGTTDHTVWIRLIGVGLSVFAIAVIVVAGARISRLLRWTPIITAMDAAWVAASIATVTLGWYSVSGAIAISLVAGVVGYLAIRQATSARNARALVRPELANLDETPPVEVVHVERRIAGSTATAWDVITDHDLYGRLALNLSRVHATNSNGPGLARTCTNRSGEHWHETCTLWDDQHRYEVAVDTTNYPYPLTVMRGAWYVEPDEPGHVRVGMDFQFQPRRGVWGRTFAVAMHAAFPFILRRIIRGWRNEIASRSASVTRRA
jgi:hypothetical protein